MTDRVRHDVQIKFGAKKNSSPDNAVKLSFII